MGQAGLMTTTEARTLATDPEVFGPDQLDELEAFYRAYGFAVLRGLFEPETMAALEAECRSAQQKLVAGQLPERFGTVELVEGDAGEKGQRFANYVTHITEVSPSAEAVLEHPVVTGLIQRWLGDTCWSARSSRFGFVYQDARPSKESSYSRIGWHSDWQSSPHLDMWPATAITVHLDGTSPANGFLRVAPGSHRWATPAPYENVNGAKVPDGSAPWGGYSEEPPPHPMPLGFEKVPGEIALYAEAGDVLFHDGYLWHSAARATVDSSVRRHVRGSWYAGAQAPEDLGPDDFVKNAAR
jgi:ectoine hydroxylase-related dioxygenase (phytanoyl-CoA dioxygenase family)